MVTAYEEEEEEEESGKERQRFPNLNQPLLLLFLLSALPGK